jgi:hypothetical protein
VIEVVIATRILGFGFLQDGDIGVGVLYVFRKSSLVLFARKTVLKGFRRHVRGRPPCVL